MKGAVLLKGARFVLTMAHPGILENADVRVEDGRIEAVGNLKKLRGDEVVDCSGSILMPGLVNCHTHSSMVALRGLNDDAPLKEWLRSMWEKEDKLTGELASKASELAFMEMVRGGTTACLDMYEAFEAAKAAERVGLRMANGPALLSRFAPGDVRLRETEEFISKYRGHDRIIPVVNLHSIYTNGPEDISMAAEMSKRENVILHVHCSETREEVFGNRKEQGRLSVEELDARGALWEKSVLVHLGWASSWEFTRMRERNAKAVHCPTSNQKLGTGGFFPFRDLKRIGITIGLGTDGAASNNSLDMFREMKEAALVQKGQYWDASAVTAFDVLEAATINGNSILGIDAGSVEPGRQADLALVRMDPVLFPLRKETINSALVYSANGHLVRGTMVGGEWIYLDGKMRDGVDMMDRFDPISKKVLDAML